MTHFKDLGLARTVLREIEKLIGQPLLRSVDQLKSDQLKPGVGNNWETRTASNACPKATSVPGQKSKRDNQIQSKPQNGKSSAPLFRQPGPDLPTDGLMRMLGKSRPIVAGIA